MKCKYKIVGCAALAFGAGALLSCVLPYVAMVFVSSAVIIGTGAILIFT